MHRMSRRDLVEGLAAAISCGALSPQDVQAACIDDLTNFVNLRYKLTGPKVWYVDPVLGNDANCGEAPGDGAFKSIAGAISKAKHNFDYAGFGPKIKLAPGTHRLPEGWQEAYPWTGGVGLTIAGAEPDTADPTDYIIVGGFNFREPGTVVLLHGMHFVTERGNQIAIQASQGAVVDINNCRFGEFTLTGTHVQVMESSKANIYKPTIVGGASSFLRVWYHSLISFNGPVVTSNEIAFEHFINLANQSTIYNAGAVLAFEGGMNCAGQKYLVQDRSTLNLGGVAEALPGTIPGYKDLTSLVQ